jgi:hypothetical protein
MLRHVVLHKVDPVAALNYRTMEALGYLGQNVHILLVYVDEYECKGSNNLK